MGIEERSHLSADLANPGVWDMRNALRFYILGDLGGSLSYKGLVGFTLDKADENAWPLMGSPRSGTASTSLPTIATTKAWAPGRPWGSSSNPR